MATGRCPTCGRSANVKATRNGMLMLICPHAIEATLEPCNTKVQLGGPKSRELSERYAGGERDIKLGGASPQAPAKQEGGRDADWF